MHVRGADLEPLFAGETARVALEAMGRRETAPRAVGARLREPDELAGEWIVGEVHGVAAGERRPRKQAVGVVGVTGERVAIDRRAGEPAVRVDVVVLGVARGDGAGGV